MPRVTDAEVKAIIDTERDVAPFIETASLIVDEDVSGNGPSVARLRQIELYLAAHFVAITEERGGLISSATGAGKETYANNFKEGLRSTRYGQQAMSLDTSGSLALAASPQKASFEVV